MLLYGFHSGYGTSVLVWQHPVLLLQFTVKVVLAMVVLAIPVQKYIAVCRGDLLFGAAKVYFVSGSNKEIWKGDICFGFGAIGCNEYQENNLFAFACKYF